MADPTTKLTVKKAIPRIFKAAVWGSLAYVLIYYLPLMLYPSEILPVDYTTELVNFAAIAVFFAVVGVLFSGTLLGCGFGIAKAVVIIAYFFVVSGSGVFSITLPFMDVPVNLTVDITIILLMIASVNLLDIVKNLLQAITILTNNTTDISLI
jgi:hypothetical protein